MIPPRNPDKTATLAEEGWSAFMSNKDSRACPYNDQARRKAWLAGHKEAEAWFANE